MAMRIRPHGTHHLDTLPERYLTFLIPELYGAVPSKTTPTNATIIHASVLDLMPPPLPIVADKEIQLNLLVLAKRYVQSMPNLRQMKAHLRAHKIVENAYKKCREIVKRRKMKEAEERVVSDERGEASSKQGYKDEGTEEQEY